VGVRFTLARATSVVDGRDFVSAQTAVEDFYFIDLTVPKKS
jgi:hypothetical protein